MLFADNNLRNLLSIAFRISLIPGVAVLVHRALKSLRYHPRDERLAVILVLLTLLAVFAFAPSQPHLREAITAVGSPHEQVRQIIYKKDGHHTGAAIKNPLGSSRARAFLSAVGFSAIIPRHRNEINIAF